jgi:hypothetical protein
MKSVKLSLALSALSLLIGLVLLVPSTAGAANWISGDESYAAKWVKDIEQELNKRDYQVVFMNDPRVPQPTVLHLLNRAAIAYEAKNPQLAKDLVQEALDVLQEGVRKNWFSQADVDPIINYIKQHVPVQVT